MVKKILTLICLISLISSGMSVLGIDTSEDMLCETQETIHIHTPLIDTQTSLDTQTSTKISLEEATSYTIDTPYELPTITKIYTYPLGTAIHDINITFSDPHIQTLTNPPRPASTTELDDGGILPQEIISTIPKEKYTTYTAGGRIDGTLKTILTIKLYPTTYDEQTKELITYTTYDIEIAYTPTEERTLSDTYDLVIIAPDYYEQPLEPLVTHKNNIGITTKLITLTDIKTSTYFPNQGRDEAEEIKYFLSYALDEWGIDYALLVGGRNGGILTEKWDLPVRYSYLNDGLESTFLTDLYYACIYDEMGGFSDWDPDGDGHYAEWGSAIGQELFDMYPDIAVGRLPCKTKNEVEDIVNKIITYETSAQPQSKRFIGVAGDTSATDGDTYYEGELATQGSYEHLQSLGYTATQLWASTGSFSGPQDVIDALQQGAGFVHFSGHGNPLSWGVHPPGDSATFIDAPRSIDMKKDLEPTTTYPIAIIGGCHNAEFSTTPLNILRGLLTDGLSYFRVNSPVGGFKHGDWVTNCWAWSLVTQEDSGAIASIANTGYGYGSSGSGWNNGRGRWMEMNFFESYANGNTTLGDAFLANIASYVTEFPPFDSRINTKLAQEWILLGDPSLQISS